MLEAATRRHKRERNARRLELVNGQQVRFLASGVRSGVTEATIVRRRDEPFVGPCAGALQVVIRRRVGGSGNRKAIRARAQFRKRRRGKEPDDSGWWAVEKVFDARHVQHGAGVAVQYLVQRRGRREMRSRH